MLSKALLTIWLDAIHENDKCIELNLHVCRNININSFNPSKKKKKKRSWLRTIMRSHLFVSFLFTEIFAFFVLICFNCKRFSIFSYLKKEKKWSFNYISIDLPLQTSKVLPQKEIIILFQEINCYQKVNK